MGCARANQLKIVPETTPYLDRFRRTTPLMAQLSA